MGQTYIFDKSPGGFLEDRFEGNKIWKPEDRLGS